MKTLCDRADEICAQPDFNWAEKYFKNAAHYIVEREDKDGKKTKSASPTAIAPKNLTRLGCRGDDTNGNLTFVFFDIDVGHGNKGRCETTDEAIQEAYKIRNWFGGRAEIRRSRSGQGVHVRHHVTGCEVPAEYGPKLAKGIAKHLGIKCDPVPLGRQCCWFYERDLEPNAFELIEDQGPGDSTLADYEGMLAAFGSRTVPTPAPAIPQNPVKQDIDFTNRYIEPADRYNMMHTCREHLENHGWTFVNQTMKQPDNIPQLHFRRPGKDSGVSGNIVVEDGHEVFYCHTSSTDLQAGRGYNPYQLYEHYIHKGNKNAAVKTLGDEYEAEFKKKDEEAIKLNNDFLDKFLGSLTAYLQPQTQDWIIRDSTDSLRLPPKRPKELIKGVCFRGSKISLSAPSKGRKTFTLMHLALCVATGTPWMGHEVTQGKVLYVNLELLDFSFHSRKEAIERNMGVKLKKGQMFELHLRGLAANIESLQKFFKERGHEFSLVIMDPLYKILGKRSENDASEMGDLLLRLENIAKMSGASLAVAHHFAKGNAAGKEIIDRHSGSGVVARDGDTIITLTPHEEDDCFTMDFTLRDFAPIEPVALRWNYPFFSVDTNLDPKKLKTARPNGMSKVDVETKILNFLKEKPPQDPVLREKFFRSRMRSHVYKAAGTPKDATKDCIDDLIDKGVIFLNTKQRLQIRR